MDIKKVRIYSIFFLIIFLIAIIYYLFDFKKIQKTNKLNPDAQMELINRKLREEYIKENEKRINNAKRSVVVMIISKNKIFLIRQGHKIIAIKPLSFSSNGIEYNGYLYNPANKTFTKIIDSQVLYEDKDFRKSKLFFRYKGISIEWSYPYWIYMPKNADVTIALTNFSDIAKVNPNDKNLKWISKQADVKLNWPKEPVFISKSGNTTTTVY